MYNRAKKKTKKELVYNHTENRWQYFERVSNQTISCAPGKVLNPENVDIEDRYGHRYYQKYIYTGCQDKLFFESY